jgi:hypothetical protein
MRNLAKTAAAMVAAVGVLAAARSASAANGVAFIHGTGDYTQATAVSSYWTQSSLDTMRGGRKYVVAGYQGASQDAKTSFPTIASQVASFINANGIAYGTNAGLVLVTHSNGVNPTRYIISHASYNSDTQTVWNVTQKVVAIAGSMKGTPLADSVTNGGTFASFANSITSFFGSDWSKPAVWLQRTDRMATANANGDFGLCPATNGGARNTSFSSTSLDTVVGSDVYAAVWSSDAYCGGYSMTAGLKAAKVYAFGYSACADGFIGCDSADYFGTNKVWDARINHNQSRRSCHGSGAAVLSDINATIGYAIPADYAIAPGAQACNATTQGWQSAAPFSGYNYWYGCTSAMKGDANTDVDCFAAYGGDNGLVAPTNFTSTGYSNSAYYSGGSVCPDSWRGDGECDLCMLAKYGYDAKDGATGADDCVNAAGDDGVVRSGTGKTNKCADLAYYNSTAQSFSGGAIGYYSYTATH